MQLTAIRLAGFKSFADNTTFPVDAPVTGIIGPNGCGKSNIIDAVRWVLGETAAKQLRGQAMTDVIFAGASNRRAAAVASVALHFDNSDGKAGGAFADYAELVIARKVLSDGQSQYSINNKRVRRRDIVELLQGTGVGARSYAVIEQGMISRIIEAKPEELRSFIEEAAGIALYKTRRKESETRMNEVREHLTRHDDRLQQLGKQRDKLEQEARIARTYRHLQQQQQEASHRLQSWQYQQLRSQLETAQAQYSHDRAALNDLFAHSGIDEHHIADLEAKLTAAKSAHKAAENEALQSAARLAQQRRALENGRQEQQHLAQNSRDCEARIARLQQQSGEDSGQQAHHQEEIERLQQERNQAAPELEQARHHSEESRSAAELLHHKLNAIQEARHHAENRCYSATHRQQEAQAQYERLEQRRTTLPMPDENEHDDQEIETLHLQNEKLEENLAVHHNNLAEMAIARQNQQQQLTQLTQQQQALEKKRAQCQAALDTLYSLQPAPAYEDPQLAAANTLLDQLQVAPEWQNAIGRYLGSHLHAVIGEEYWQRALNAGQAQLAHGDIPSAWHTILSGSINLHPWFAHIQPLAQHDTDIQRDSLAANNQYLSLDGTLISRDSILPAAAADDLLARQSQIAALEQQCDETELALQEIAPLHAAAQQNLQALEQQQQAQQQQLQQLQQQQRDLQHRLVLLEQTQAHKAQLAAQHARTAQSLAEDLTAAQRQLEQAQHEVRQATEALAALPAAVEIEQQFRHQHAQYQQAERAYHALLEAMRQTENAIEQHRAHLNAGEKQQQRLSDELEENHHNLASLRERLETLSLQLEEDHLRLITLEETHQQHEQQRADNARLVEEQAHNLHREQEILREQQHRRALAEERLSHHQSQIEQLQQQLQRLVASFLSDDKEPLTFEANESLDEQALTQEIRQLKQQMEALGAVNLAAIDDYDSAQHEYDVLDTQCRDLRDTLALLEEAISKLDNETRQRLQETLNIVNQNFAALFPLLFRGGEAELAWTEGDILDAGITIAVRPPGKKVKNLSVLSGGEKALTALALVFALFRLNPAPFCLLDEVDAPLDDANVGRLCTLLREMATHTQFIVITHRKRTMQTCDQLIGVTMSEPGVSRLVAVQFDD
ncbi:MAG: AAA family ATPase [Cardiobacteriaceae bacterium]|nr:AAA family ATPase [Cardiobacteriaceae bacterium]